MSIIQTNRKCNLFHLARLGWCSKIIHNLDPNKADGYDMISMRMLKIYTHSLYKPLQLIFRSCIVNKKFLSEWKKDDVVPVHKKGNKQSLKIYCPVFLLPIFGKIFERLIYNSLFEFFIANEIISSNQSGFKPDDSCINQLLSITHEIINLLMMDMKLEVFPLIHQKHLIKFSTMDLFN